VKLYNWLKVFSCNELAYIQTTDWLSCLKQQSFWLAFMRCPISVSAGHWLPSLQVSQSLSITSRLCCGIPHNRPKLPHSTSFLIHYHPTVWCCSVWATDNFVTETTKLHENLFHCYSIVTGVSLCQLVDLVTTFTASSASSLGCKSHWEIVPSGEALSSFGLYCSAVSSGSYLAAYRYFLLHVWSFGSVYYETV